MGRAVSGKSGFLAGFIPPFIVAAVIGAGLLIYYHTFGASDARYDRAISNCLRERTFGNASSTAREEATLSCARDIPRTP